MQSTWYTANISPGLLLSGNNLLAVEVHQANGTSTDVSFDASLIATVSNNTAVPSLVVNDVVLTEGNSGPKAPYFGSAFRRQCSERCSGLFHSERNGDCRKRLHRSKWNPDFCPRRNSENRHHSHHRRHRERVERSLLPEP